ncbi:LWR-salt protein [Natrialbaceae archaeon AArc-T1-2]|uniref:LWR-salt protein n=1 Tax=Natrialbaceae archaeon AArc-T1-2 TaxID=3053904 RepID=UPI00255AE637|nr:LWR-salt protein [Natrialbaceae archaeon AArc-T1-2]WIV67599.1 LWR-salt protein [Natrialbaceae archaeon AArc-T1-2]
MSTIERELPADAARYVFRIECRLEPTVDEVSVVPDRFQTTMYRTAAPPGEDGWLFFRNTLWRGELEDPDHFRRVAEDVLGVSVTSVSFSELQTGEKYLAELETAIGDSLETFNADTVEEALTKYLGSSVRVVSD